LAQNKFSVQIFLKLKNFMNRKNLTREEVIANALEPEFYCLVFDGWKEANRWK